jgi:hypothetical protein
MRRFATLFLLLLVGFGLMAGPHPCHALQAPQAKAMDAMPACHAHRAAASGTAQPVLSAARHDCCRDDAQSRLCESTCQMAAAFHATISLPAVRFVAPAPQPSFGHTPLPLAHPIDHVPLA